MATLTKPQKMFIIEGLACCDTPSQVAEHFEEEFGIEIDRRQVANYDGSKKNSRQRMAKALVAYFDECQKVFEKEYERIPIAKKARRLLMLDRMAEKAAKMKNYPLTAQLLEQAAKEMGEAYTNRKLVDMTSGGERIQGVVFTKPGE